MKKHQYLQSFGQWFLNKLKVLNYTENKFDITSELIFHKDKDIFYSMQCFIDIVNEYVISYNS